MFFTFGQNTQELGRIYFEVMKDSVFEEGVDEYDSDEEEDTDLFSRLVNAPAATLLKAAGAAMAATAAAAATSAYFYYRRTAHGGLP